MKEILEKVPTPKYKIFRQMAMERCRWTRDQYWNRKIGKTKLTNLEREALNGIVLQLAELHNVPVQTQETL